MLLGLLTTPIITRIVNPNEYGQLSIFTDLLPDALHPVAEGAGILARTVYSALTGDYGGSANPYPAIRIRHPESVYQLQIIAYELVPVMGPITGVRVVQSQMNHHPIRSESHRIPELLLLPVRPVAFV